MKDNAIWFPFTQMKTAPEPLRIQAAKDAILTAHDGRTYIDVNSSWWVNVHGHGNEYIGKAIADQFQILDHVLLAGVSHPKAEELAERIVEKLPSKFEKVFFSDDGSTAVEVALKMVFQYWFNKGEERRRVLALDGAYHGDTFGAMSVGQRGYFNKPFEHLFFDVDYIDFPTRDNEEALLKRADELFSTNEFAGVILEPLVQGSAGMRMYRPAFLQALVELAQKHNVKVIFDEVMTGWGRTGRLFAMDYIEAKPDIVCLSKGLTGGVLPLGLTVATQEIFNAFLNDDKSKALLHGHSFTGSALACSAACASLDIFEEKETWEKVAQIVQSHEDFVNRIAGKYAIETRQQGTILALEIQENGSDYFSNVRDKAYDFFLANGILMRPLGNVLFLNPPY
ncbi:MAG: adenosylmethionine--8-amino-7-oxononanoate transaminase, partial [Crocinitomicaceae bacterium]|nr:adenosylmethionine--8-amino-7-oxononanoate transaminase [Crocinitomicaceae bacterium]